MGACLRCFRKNDEVNEAVIQDVAEDSNREKGKKKVSKTKRRAAAGTSGESDTKEKPSVEPEATTTCDKNENVELQKLSAEKLTADAGNKDELTKSNTGCEQPIPIEIDGQEPIKDGQEPIKDGQEPLKDGQEPLEDGQEPIKDGQESIKDGQEPIKDGEEPTPIKMDAQELIGNKTSDEQLNVEAAKAITLPTDNEANDAQLPVSVADRIEGEAGPSNAQDEVVLQNKEPAEIQLEQEVKADVPGAQEASEDVKIHEADTPAKALPVDAIEKSEEEASGVAMEATVDEANSDVTKEDDVNGEINVDVNEVQSQDETTESEVSKQLHESSNDDQSEEDDDEAEMSWTDMSFSQPLVAQLSEVVHIGVIARVPEIEVAAETSSNDIDETGNEGDKNDDEQSELRSSFEDTT